MLAYFDEKTQKYVKLNNFNAVANCITRSDMDAGQTLDFLHETVFLKACIDTYDPIRKVACRTCRSRNDCVINKINKNLKAEMI